MVKIRNAQHMIEIIEEAKAEAKADGVYFCMEHPGVEEINWINSTLRRLKKNPHTKTEEKQWQTNII